MDTVSKQSRIDLTKPRYDQSTYMGRLKHFLQVTNPMNILVSDEELERSKVLVQQYKYNIILNWVFVKSSRGT